MTKTLNPPTRPPRVSVPVSAEALEAFERLAVAGNMSTGKAIASWLDDTVEAAQFMASKMEQARAAPKIVMREMHAYALGLADETGDLMRKMTAKGKENRSGDRAKLAPHEAPDSVHSPSPPSSNTGGKVPRVNPKPRGSKFPMPPAKVQAYADNNGRPPVGLK